MYDRLAIFHIYKIYDRWCTSDCIYASLAETDSHLCWMTSQTIAQSAESEYLGRLIGEGIVNSCVGNNSKYWKEFEPEQ